MNGNKINNATTYSALSIKQKSLPISIFCGPPPPFTQTPKDSSEPTGLKEQRTKLRVLAFLVVQLVRVKVSLIIMICLLSLSLTIVICILKSILLDLSYNCYRVCTEIIIYRDESVPKMQEYYFGWHQFSCACRYY